MVTRVDIIEDGHGEGEVVDWNWSGRSLEPTEGAGGRAEVETRSSRGRCLRRKASRTAGRDSQASKSKIADAIKPDRVSVRRDAAER